MKSLVNYFLRDFSEDAPSLRNQGYYLIVANFITMGCSVFFTPLYWSTNTFYIVIAAIFTVSLSAITLWHFRVRQNLMVASTLFATNGIVLICFLVFYSGGLKSPFLPWVALFPGISILLGNKIQFIINYIFLFLIISVSWAFQPYLSEINMLDAKWTTNFIVINLFTLSAFFTITIWAYHQNNKKNAEKLENTNKELERFAYIASHDMKEPLRNITSFAQLLSKRAAPKLNEQELDYLNFITQNAQLMNQLIIDVLEFSTIGRDDAAIDWIDLTEMVELAVQNLKINIQDKNATVTWGKLPKVRGRESHFIQLFQNLIENGLKYNHSETPNIVIDAQQSPTHHHIRFQDNGIGIDEAFQDKVFEMFLRLHNRGEYEGTGIGLALCKKVTEMYNGQIEVEESSQKGTTFLITLPNESSRGKVNPLNILNRK